MQSTRYFIMLAQNKKDYANLRNIIVIRYISNSFNNFVTLIFTKYTPRYGYRYTRQY
jgi:hypothetical protein